MGTYENNAFIKDGHRLIKILSDFPPYEVIALILYPALALVMDYTILRNIQDLIPLFFLF